MSSAAHADHNGHHVSGMGLYLGVFGALLVLTVATVLVSTEALFHGAMSIGVAMAIATVKASLVATFFMHLKWDRTFNVIVFVASLWFAGLFFSFTLLDLSSRTRVDPVNQHNLPTMQREAGEH